MKEKITIVFLVSSLLVYPALVWAIPNAYVNEAWTLQDIVDFVGTIRDFFLIVGIILILVFVVWAGIAFLAARGNPEKVEEAKRRFLWTAVGTAVILATYAIISTIRAVLEKRWG